MNHGNFHRKFGRTNQQRKALLSNLANALIQQEHIMTTLPKAKDLRPIVEKLVTKCRQGNTLSNYRQAYKFLRSNDSCKKLVSDLGPRFIGRPGGYLRIVKAGYRYGDQAPMAVIEFVQK